MNGYWRILANAYHRAYTEKVLEGKMFLNISNHRSDFWGKNQLDAAHQFGEIIDIPFPQISSEATTREIDQRVSEYVEKIRAYEHPVVMVQGEFVFTFRLVTELKKEGITVVASATERKAEEQHNEDGTTTKTTVFEYRGFREY